MASTPLSAQNRMMGYSDLKLGQMPGHPDTDLDPLAPEVERQHVVGAPTEPIRVDPADTKLGSYNDAQHDVPHDVPQLYDQFADQKPSAPFVKQEEFPVAAVSHHPVEDSPGIRSLAPTDGGIIHSDPATHDDGSDEPSENLPEKLKREMDNILGLKKFLFTAPASFGETDIISKYQLPTDEQVACVRWHDIFFITGTDIVRCLAFRFQAFGRVITNKKKFEEGIFSDLRNLKCSSDATLEKPKSEFLEFLYKHHCVRTKKKQKVFHWFSVKHDRLFIDALERDLKKEAALATNNGTGDKPTTKAVSEPALSFPYDANQSLHEQISLVIGEMPTALADMCNATFCDPGGPPVPYTPFSRHISRGFQPGYSAGLYPVMQNPVFPGQFIPGAHMPHQSRGQAPLGQRGHLRVPSTGNGLSPASTYLGQYHSGPRFPLAPLNSPSQPIHPASVQTPSALEFERYPELAEGAKYYDYPSQPASYATTPQQPMGTEYPPLSDAPGDYRGPSSYGVRSRPSRPALGPLQGAPTSSGRFTGAEADLESLETDSDFPLDFFRREDLRTGTTPTNAFFWPQEGSYDTSPGTGRYGVNTLSTGGGYLNYSGYLPSVHRSQSQSDWA